MKFVFLFTTLLLSSGCFAQSRLNQAQNPSQTTSSLGDNKVILAELAQPLDAKKCEVGQQIEVKSTMDLLAHGKIVLPRDTKIIGHVTTAKKASKQSRLSKLGIAFDRIILKNGKKLALQAEIQAIGLPLNAFTHPEPMPVESLANMQVSALSGGSPIGAGSGMAALSPYTIPQTMPDLIENSFSSPNSMRALDRGSQGVVGLRQLSLRPSLQNSVVSSEIDNVHLDKGTQLILRLP